MPHCMAGAVSIQKMRGSQHLNNNNELYSPVGKKVEVNQVMNDMGER